MHNQSLIKWRLFALAAVFLSSVALAQPTSPAAPAQTVSPETVLIEGPHAKVTKRDFDLEVARLPPEMRDGVVNSQRRIAEVVGRLLVIKTLANEARTNGEDRDPDVQAKLALETDRLYSQVRQARLDEQAGAEFDAKRAQWEARAREIYAAERSQFVSPAEVSAAHILFSTQQHKSDEAKKLADEARARIAAGADFNELAKSVSEDPTAKKNGGSIGYFTRATVDPAFAQAAFALKNVGDVSEPVLSSFGWHLIKLESRKPATQKSFDEVRDAIMSQLRQKFIADRREAMLAAIGSDPAVKPNVQALESIYIHPANERAVRGSAPTAPAAAR